MRVRMSSVCVCVGLCVRARIIIEGRETAFDGFEYQFTTGKPLKSLKLTLNYHENGSSRDNSALWLKAQTQMWAQAHKHTYIQTTDACIHR